MPSFRRYYCPKNIFFSLFLGLFSISSAAAEPPGSGARAFAQLEQALPTPNVYRTASGAPGIRYWQQQANYKIDVTLDAETGQFKPNRVSAIPIIRRIDWTIYGYNLTRIVSLKIRWIGARAP